MQNIEMPASSPNHEALLAVTQRSKARKQELEQVKREIELSKRQLDLEYEELSLQRRKLEVQEKEIATKREELDLTLTEKVAYMTMALDRDVQSRVALGSIDTSTNENDQVQQVTTEQEATDAR
jgi:hypothetical protein